jgi:hypothetical protein
LWKRSFQSSIQFKSMQKRAAWLHGQESTSVGAATPGADREKDHTITDRPDVDIKKAGAGAELEVR